MQKHEWYSDTGAKAFEVFLARQRAMTPTEKIQAVFEQNELLWSMSEARERLVSNRALMCHEHFQGPLMNTDERRFTKTPLSVFIRVYLWLIK
jgi:hypothetical protein